MTRTRDSLRRAVPRAGRRRQPAQVPGNKPFHLGMASAFAALDADPTPQARADALALLDQPRGHPQRRLI